MKKTVALLFLFASFHLSAQTLKDALRLTDNEQFEAARDAYNTLIIREPNNGTYYYYLGENYLLSEEPDSALVMYERAEKADANNVLIMIGRAKYDLNKFSIAERKRLLDFAVDDLAKAQAEYDKSAKTPEDEVRLGEAKAKAGEAKAIHETAISLVKEANILIDEAIQKVGAKPKESRVFIEAADALIHFKNHDFDKAKIFLEQAKKIEAANPEINILFGDIYSKLNNGTLVAQYYNEALEQDRTSVKSIVNKGRLYGRTGNREGAAEEFNNAIKINADYAPAHRELGEVYYQLGKLDLAKQEYRTYLDLSKNNCSARQQYAYFLYVSKDYVGALNEIKQIGQKCDQNSLKLLRVTAYCYYETKDSVNALKSAQKLFSKLTEEKTIVRDYEYYGKTLALNNMDSLAVDMLRKAYQMDNSRCDLLKEIYNCYDKLKKNSEAAAVLFEKIQNCKGATVADYFNMGRSWFFAGEFLKADSAFAKVNELSPKYASGYLWRAKANTRIDSTSALGMAKPYYEKYIEIALGDTTATGKYKAGLIESYRYLSSYYYFQLKDRNKAKEFLRKILELDPADKDADDGIKGIEFQEKQERERREKNKSQ